MLKQLVATYYNKVWNKRDLRLIPYLFSDNCRVNYNDKSLGTSAIMTPKDIRRKIEDWIAIVPDIKVNIITIISDKNFVLAYCSLTGIHRGNWMDIPPTGKPINIPMFNMYKIEGGKICEQWNVTNLFDVTAQMKIADMKCTIPEII